MVKKATDTPELEAAPQKRLVKSFLPKPRKGPGGLTRHALLAILACSIVVVVATYFLQSRVIGDATEQERDRLATTYARQYVAAVNQLLGSASSQMAGIVGAEGIREALATNDPSRLAGAASDYTASLGGQSQVFLLPMSSPIETTPLGYAALDMVDRARRGEAMRPEFIPLKERPLLLMAAPVKDPSGTVAGVLLVGFDLLAFKDNLKVFDAQVGRMSLLQAFEGEEPLAVMDYGIEPGAPAASAEEETLYPHLRVRFSLSETAVVPMPSLVLWMICGIVILVIAAVVLLAQTFAGREVKRNTSMLLQLGENLLRRERPPAGIQFTLGVFEEAAASLSKTSRDAASLQPAARNSTGRTGVQGAVSTSSFDALDLDDIDSAISPEKPAMVPDEIFRAYDIRGIVEKSLTIDTMRLLGKAVGSEALANSQQALYVGRDGRLSGPQFVSAFSEGVASTGCRVIDLGMVPTPVVYFAAANSATKSCVVVTGSHNPSDYNGLKIVIAGETLAEARIQGLKQRIRKGDFQTGKGSVETQDFSKKYCERIRDDIVLARPMKVVLDCGNGVAGAVAPELLSSFGCSVIPLFCDVDGHFPNHHPDPSKPENLQELIAAVAREKADLGLAFDGDGDRIGVVTPKGQIIFPDRLMMLYARDLLMRSPGADIIFDVKCTRDLAAVISQNGGRPIMWRTGHSLIKAKLKESGAALAGEMSGHIFFNDRWPGFDDAMYAAARLLEILSLETEGIDEVFDEFPKTLSTPEINVPVPETRKFSIIEALQQNGDFSGGNLITIDGVRVDYPDGWGLLRASNTTPVLVARFEAKTTEEMDRIKGIFREQLSRLEPSLKIPF